MRRQPLLVLLGFVPIAIGVRLFAPERTTLVFFTSVIAIVPLASLMGAATEELAAHLGSGIGGLLNATFGNAAELIIAALALRAGLDDLVKASLTGSIIGNVLMVFGAAALAGGLKHPVQQFNRTAAAHGTTMLMLSVIGLVVPAMFHLVSNGRAAERELRLDTAIAAVLFVTYCISLVFTLKTHRDLYGVSQQETKGRAAGARPFSAQRAVVTLLVATVGVAIMSELLVNAVSEAARTLGMSELFVGVVIVAIVGNAAEHYSAIVLAAQNDMDTAISIAVGSSTQIALFVAPALLFLSYAIAPQPMDLLFTSFEVVAIGLAVTSIALVAHDGETHWMEGVQLLAVYLILSLGFYYLPSR